MIVLVKLTKIWVPWRFCLQFRSTNFKKKIFTGYFHKSYFSKNKQILIKDFPENVGEHFPRHLWVSGLRKSLYKSESNYIKEIHLRTQPTFQRRINVVSTLWINVEITFIGRWKWNKIRRWIFNVTENWYNVSDWRWNNVKTTLHKFKTTLQDVGTTLFQPSVDVS